MFQNGKVQKLLKKFGLDWVVVNCRSDYGRQTIIIAPYFDGSVPEKELLKRDIPFGFILRVKLLHLGARVVVRGMITANQITREHESFECAWEATEG